MGFRYSKEEDAKQTGLPHHSRFDSCPIHLVLMSVFLGVKVMHYRNGRPAKNGDEIVSLESGSGKINGVGVLIRAVPGNDFCNGIIANDRTGSFVGAVLCDCLHVDDVASLLAEKCLDKRRV